MTAPSGHKPLPPTPGPWEMHPDGIPYFSCSVAGAAFGPVVMAGSHEQMVADAKLMAAAPDLLAACEVAEEMFRLYARVHQRKGTSAGQAKAESNRVMADRLREAINRARGVAA